MPRDFLFPSVPGVSGVTTLTANAALTTAMLGTLVQLSGFTLSLAALDAADFGVVCVAGPGSIGGLLEQDLSENEVTMIAVQGASFDWIQSSGPGGAVAIAGVTGLTAALAAKANAAEVIRFDASITALTGGGVGSLDGLATVALPVGLRIQIIADGVLLTYRLGDSWNLFATGIAQVTPADHDMFTNVKFWDLVQAGVTVGGLVGASDAVASMLTAQNREQLRGTLGVRASSSVVSVRSANEPPGMGRGVQAVGSGFAAEPGETIPPDFKLRGVEFEKSNDIGLRIYYASMLPYPVMPLTWSAMERTFEVTVNTDAFADYGALALAINVEIAATVATQAEAALIFVDVAESAGNPIDPFSYTSDRLRGGFSAEHGDRILLIATGDFSGSEVYFDAINESWVPVPRIIESIEIPDVMTVAPTLAPAQIYTWLLTGHRTLDDPYSMPPGTYLLRIIQDSVGGWSLAFGVNFVFPGGVLPPVSSAPGAESLLFLHGFGGPTIYVTSYLNFIPAP